MDGSSSLNESLLDHASTTVPRRSSSTRVIVPVLDDTDEEPVACQEESTFSKAETRGLRVVLSFFTRAHRLMKNRVFLVVSQLILWTLLLFHVYGTYKYLDPKYVSNTSSYYNNKTNGTSGIPVVFFAKKFFQETFPGYLLPIGFYLWTYCRKTTPVLQFGPSLVRVGGVGVLVVDVEMLGEDKR